MAVAKFGGRDCELSTTGIGADGQSIDAWTVTRAVLAQVDPALEGHGVSVWPPECGDSGGYHGAYGVYQSGAYSRDCLRHWTSGGQCYYSDMGHVEVCTASCLYPTTFAAQNLSLLLAAEEARKRAQEAADTEVTYALTTSNADLLDPAISFGTHLSMQISKPLWEDLMVDQRHPAILGFVSSVMAAAIPFFGAGYLLPVNTGTLYSLSGRAHHLTRTRTVSTTEPFRRGLLNSRRESHSDLHERLHLIGFDFDILSSALLFSLLQCALVAAEEGYCGLNLVDPVRALRIWSWKIDVQRGRLPATALLVDGRRLTLPQYMHELATQLLHMVDSDLITQQLAPEAGRMLPRIIDLAGYAQEGALLKCARHLSWAAKLLWITQLIDQEGTTLDDPMARVADHDFASTDPERGALWRLWESDLVDPLTDLESAKACLAEGPMESRDWGRGRIIQRFCHDIDAVDWSYVTLRSHPGRWSPRLRIDMPQLDSLNKSSFQDVIDTVADPADLHQLLACHRDIGIQETDPIDDLQNQLATTTRVAEEN